jgi:hypothetical protein
MLSFYSLRICHTAAIRLAADSRIRAARTAKRHMSLQPYVPYELAGEGYFPYLSILYCGEAIVVYYSAAICIMAFDRNK